MERNYFLEMQELFEKMRRNPEADALADFFERGFGALIVDGVPAHIEGILRSHGEAIIVSFRDVVGADWDKYRELHELAHANQGEMVFQNGLRVYPEDRKTVFINVQEEDPFADKDVQLPEEEDDQQAYLKNLYDELIANRAAPEPEFKNGVRPVVKEAPVVKEIPEEVVQKIQPVEKREITTVPVVELAWADVPEECSLQDGACEYRTDLFVETPKKIEEAWTKNVGISEEVSGEDMEDVHVRENVPVSSVMNDKPSSVKNVAYGENVPDSSVNEPSVMNESFVMNDEPFFAENHFEKDEPHFENVDEPDFEKDEPDFGNFEEPSEQTETLPMEPAFEQVPMESLSKQEDVLSESVQNHETSEEKSDVQTISEKTQISAKDRLARFVTRKM